jgi:hypothetical protein
MKVCFYLGIPVISMVIVVTVVITVIAVVVIAVPVRILICNPLVHAQN